MADITDDQAVELLKLLAGYLQHPDMPENAENLRIKEVAGDLWDSLPSAWRRQEGVLDAARICKADALVNEGLRLVLPPPSKLHPETSDGPAGAEPAEPPTLSKPHPEDAG